MKVKKYTTQDNGAEPFVVEDYGNKIIVTVQKFIRDTIEWEPDKKVLDIEYNKIFVGADPLKISPYWESSFRGNSILVQVSDKEYTFIGDRIFSFELVKDDSIEKYISYMGNSLVAYPYAIGKTHTYLMLEHVFIENEVLDLKKDVYSQYYGFDSDEKEVKKIMKAAHPLKEKTIVKRVAG